MTVIDRVVEGARRIPRIVVDGAIGLAIFVVGTIEVTARHPTRPSAMGLVAVAALGVTLRRTNTWVAWALAMLAAVAGVITTDGYGFGLFEPVAGLILVYTVSERCPAAVSVLALIAGIVMAYLPTHLPGHWTEGNTAAFVLAYVLWLGLAWFAGRAQARRRALASNLERSSDELREERDRLARSAVATERARIARELHALASRGVERMSAEAGAARRHLASNPARASRAIGAIEAGGRATLVEMRRLLVVLRARDGAAAGSSDRSAPREQRPDSAGAGNSLAQRPWLMRGQWRTESTILRRASRWIAIPWMADALVVLVLAAMAIYEASSHIGFLITRLDLVFMALILGTLLFRRLAPRFVFAAMASVTFAWYVFPTGGAWTADIAMAIAVYTVAALLGPWWGLAAIGANAVAYVHVCSGVCMVTWATQFMFVVIAGIAVHEGRRLLVELRAQSDLLRRTREERVRLAVDEERTRIARDVHDMVAHGVTLAVIQAGAARWLAEADPAKADRALRSVERAGQEALQELRSLVGSLGSASPDRVEPLPANERLTMRSVIDQATEAGIDVDLVTDGEPRQLEAGLEVSLYRIVQEALTNVRKHAPGAKACVELRYAAEGVDVEVTDSGGGGQITDEPAIPGAGQGLVGIAERVALFGGRTEAGPTPEGGFRVHAWLPGERVLA